jgi:hypothetical protein
MDLRTFRSSPNAFGLLREYHGRLPLHDPEDDVPLSELINRVPPPPSTVTKATTLSSHPRKAAPIIPPPTTITQEMYSPYANYSTALLHTWYFGHYTKSKQDLDFLVSKILQNDHFNPMDVKKTALAAVTVNPTEHELIKTIFDAIDGWHQTTVPIRVPFGKRALPATYEVRDLYHRSLLGLACTVCESDAALRFHFDPYLLVWKPGNGEPEQTIQGEFYTSRAFMEAHEELLNSPAELGCDHPRAVLALMVGSDSTRVAQFGTASLWPAYLMFGNESKYTRGKPSAHAVHHLAYFPKVCTHCVPNEAALTRLQLADDIQDFIRSHTGGVKGSAALLTHCQRELMHAVYNIIFDDEFIEAYIHGFVVKCGDGITRRLYPRLFTYIADYPEKYVKM